MTKDEKQWKAKLADMACLICERIYGQHSGGDVQLHHIMSARTASTPSARKHGSAAST